MMGETDLEGGGSFCIGSRYLSQNTPVAESHTLVAETKDGVESHRNLGKWAQSYSQQRSHGTGTTLHKPD